MAREYTSKTLRGVLTLTITLFRVFLSSSFNLDFEYAVVKQGPKDSLFGFSVAQHIEGANKWILVGAPTSDSKYLIPRGIRSSGTVFQCNAGNTSASCDNELKLDSAAPGKNAAGQEIEQKRGMWLGVSVKSLGVNRELMACAHRFMFYTNQVNFNLTVGSCYAMTSRFNDLGVSRPWSNLIRTLPAGTTISHENYGESSIGVGLDIVRKSNGDPYFVIGGIGVKSFAGTVFEDDLDVPARMGDVNEKYIDSYFGYSITHGTFFDPRRTDIATGGPRHNSFGKVLIYKPELEQLIVEIPGVESEIQIASGFGFAIAAMDADNDTYSELVVGAPFYSSSKDFPDQGIVYIYKMSSGSNMKLSMVLESKAAKSNFGAALARAGDLNLDGYEDLVVGAPHEDGGQGAVYLFQGSNGGLVKDPTQVIRASEVTTGLRPASGMMGFGRSFSAGLDMDSNGYADVVVGSYLSGHVALLRARPVINVHFYLEFEPEEINPAVKNCDERNGEYTATCMVIKFCHNYTEPTKNLDGTQSIEFTMEVDPIRKPRVAWLNAQDPEKRNIRTFTVDSTSADKPGQPRLCKVLSGLKLVPNADGIVPIYPDIEIIVAHEIPYGQKIPKPTADPLKVTSLDQYPALQRIFDGGTAKASQRIKTKVMKFKRECVACIPDLALLTSANHTLRLGSKSYSFNFTLDNNGRDPAYAVAFEVALPKDLQVDGLFDGVNVRPCVATGNGTVTCENVFSKFSSGQEANLALLLNTREFTPLSKNAISLKVTSANTENGTYADNMVNVSFAIKAEADLILSGLAAKSVRNILYNSQVKGESLMRKVDDVGQAADHTYVVKNTGPDLLPTATLTIFWPFEAKSGKHLLYMTGSSSSSRSAKCVFLPGERNILGLMEHDRMEDASSEGLPVKRLSPGISAQAVRQRRDADTTAARGDGDGDVVATKSPTTTVKQAAAVKPNDGPVATAEPVVPKGESGLGKTGVILDCKTAKCTIITCSLVNMEKDSTVTITIKSRLWEPTLVLDHYAELVTIVSSARVAIGDNSSFIKDPHLDNNDSEMFTVVTPVFPPKSKEGVAVWKIALAVVAGVILLVLVIFGLFKLGFFKRTRGDSAYDQPAEDSTKKSLLGKKSSNGY